MDNADNDLLISAYLDGELTAEEREHVEQLLASSAEARQLIDELRTLRANLQEPPQHTLELEFAQRVLNRAERELNAERIALVAAESDPTGLNPPLNQPAIDPAAADRALAAMPGNRARPAESSEFGKQLRRVLTNRRGLGWSLVAIAAGIVIMVSSRQPEDNRVAAKNQTGDSVAMKAAPPVRGLSTLDPKPGEAAARPSISNLATNSPAPVQSDQFGIDSASALRPSTLAKEAAPETSTGVVAKGAVQEQETPLDGTLAFSRNRAAGANPAGQASAANSFGKLEAGQEVQSPTELGELLVVQVSMSPEAAQRGDFERLLARHHIAMDNVQADRETMLRRLERGSGARGESVERLPRLAQSSSEQQWGDRSEREKLLLEGLAEQSKDQVHSYNFATPAPTDGSADLVYVEATASQINDTLTDLQNTPQEFRLVTLSENPPEAGVPSQESNQQRGRFAADSQSEQGQNRGTRRGGLASGRGGQVAGSRGGFGGGGFGGGGMGGRAPFQPAPAAAPAAEGKAKSAELKKADDAVDSKVAGANGPGSGTDRSFESRKPQENQLTDELAPVQGRAVRLKLPEAAGRIALGTDLNMPRDDVMGNNPLRQKANSEGELDARRYESRDGAEVAIDRSVQPPSSQPAAPPLSAAAPAQADKSMADLEAHRNAFDLPTQAPSRSNSAIVDGAKASNGSTLAGSPAMPTNGRQPSGGVASSSGPRRALFVLRILPTPAAAKPAADSSAPAPAGRNP